ncbi:MAG TPA: alpha/beta hydrolase [Gemmatimonadota bacterium]|nr:alpha/beta hydrolase [Gemmatimonadota bacterium]
MGSPRKLAGAALAAGAAAIALPRLLSRRTPDLPRPAAGNPRTYAWRHAELFLTVRGQGPAALLLHDLYTGASAAEMDGLADRLADRLEVHVADLPGFGRSGRPAMRYTPDLFFDAIVELVRHAIDRPTLLVGSGVTGAFAAEAALRLGNSAAGLVLLGPPEPDPEGFLRPPLWGGAAYQILRSPLGHAYHWWHASPVVQRRTLELDLATSTLDLEERARSRSRSARQPGGAWPLWSLWTGDLVWDPRPALARLGAPALVLWGAETRGDPAAPEAYRAVRPDLAQEVVPGTARWPHVDAPEAAAEALLEWWDGQAASATAPPDPESAEE